MGRPLVARRISHWRKERGLTQRQVAALLRVGQSDVARIEAGIQRINDEQVERLARSLGVSVAEFYDETPRNEAS